MAHIMFEREGSMGGGRGGVPKIEQRGGNEDAGTGLRRRWDEATAKKSMWRWVEGEKKEMASGRKMAVVDD